MFAVKPAAMDADYADFPRPGPGPAAGKNAAVKTFIRYAAFKARLPCAPFLAADG
jgi:hypothetical protein